MLLLLSGLLFTACDSSSPVDDTDEITIDDIDTEAILTSEANDVILATYHRSGDGSIDAGQ